MARFSEVLTIINGKNQKSVENPNGKYLIYGSGGIMGRADGYICEAETVVIGRKGSINKPIFVEEPFWNVDTAFGLAANRSILLPKYLYYFCEKFDFEQLNTTVTIPSLTKANLLEIEIRIPSLETQSQIVSILDRVSGLIALRKQQLAKLDELVKARFVEMFGDPLHNSLGIPTIELGTLCSLKAGITTSAEDIHEESTDYSVPCYGGNGIRGYVNTSTQEGTYPIIGRQGALCGNVQLATGKFHATEHAVIVKPLMKANTIWIFYMLKYIDLFRYHTGAAQPGLAVKTLNTIAVPYADPYDQDIFSDFANQVEKQKLTIQKGLYKLEILKKALMQEYFG